MNDKNIAAFILAGGEGRRVGRQNKGLLSLNSHPLVNHVIQRIQPHVKNILISANNHIETYQSFGFPVYQDLPQWKGKGPLAGIVSLYSFIPAHTDYILVVPCDTPFLPANLVSSLYHALISNPDLLIAYAATPKQIHPSILLCKPCTNDYLANHLNHQHYSLKSWISAHPNIKVNFHDEHEFTNINDLDTLTRYQQGRHHAKKL